MKVNKTNAMRILQNKGLEYEIITYECDDFIDGVQVANIIGIPVEQSFKTLILIGKSGNYYVFVIPVGEKINLKKAAKEAKEKSMELIPTKDCLKVSGYVRGSVSPFGMKKQYKTFIEESAQMYDEIVVSGGRKGLSLRMKSEDVCTGADGIFVDTI